MYRICGGYSLPGSAGSSSGRSRTAAGRRHCLSSGRDWPSATESPAAWADRYTEFLTRQILDPAVGFLSIERCVQPEKNFTKRNEEYIEYNVFFLLFLQFYNIEIGEWGGGLHTQNTGQGDNRKGLIHTHKQILRAREKEKELELVALSS